MNLKTSVIAAFAVLRLALPPAASGAADALGVAQVYPSAAGGKEWVSKWNTGVARTFTWGKDPQDPWFDAKGDGTYAVDGKGLLKISGSTPRLYVYDPLKASSWRNVEMTVYAMRVADDSTAYAGIVAIARTNHGTTGPETANLCDTRGYGGRMRLDGKIDFDKETSHPSATAAASKKLYAGGLPKNVWIGYKYVVYDLPDGNVKLEMWRDTTDGLNGGTWVKVNEFTDTGANFGAGAAACKAGINPALRLTNSDARPGSESGKPNISVYWRSTNVGTNGLVYKKMTVREITPGAAAPADATAPVITAMAASGIGQNGATIGWTTNENADTQVEYGPTSAYGASTVLNTALSTSHSAVLSGLTAGTLYHYRVKSKDQAGNLATSAGSTFTTASAPSPGAVCVNSAGSWANAAMTPQSGAFTAEFDATPSMTKMDGASGLSNAAASSYAALAAAVRFNNMGTIDARNGGAYAAAASIPYVAGLPYHFRLVVNLPAHTYSAYVKQGTGAEQLIGANYAFRTEQNTVASLNNVGLLASTGSESLCALTAAASDATAPVLTAVAVSAIGQTGATIGWTTNENADTQVEYGPTSAYGASTLLNTALSTSHSAVLSGLTAGTLYHYRVKSRDQAGNLAVSAGSTFTTAAATGMGPVISGVTTSGVGSGGAAILWTTSVPADSQVEYGLTASYGSATALDAFMTTSHTGNLLALSPSTLYHYRVKSRDAAGNLTTSADYVFTTNAAAALPPTVTGGFYDDFSTYEKNICFPDGHNFGPWTAAYSGYGCIKTATAGTVSYVEEAPKAPTAPAETHASMILGPAFSGPINYSLNIMTVAQLRTGSAPNPWEVAWVAWNYTDDTHFYYLALKPNGWELGKEDPAYPGAQRFLATGSSPVYPIGLWYNIRIVQDAANVIKIYADDRLITTYTDTERPYTSGRIGFYNEDAQVRVKDVAVNISAPVVASIGVAAHGQPVLAPQKLLSPARADGINDAAVFGAAASEVSVYDIRGKSVFHSAQQPIVWNGRDGAGRVVESGVYIARIREAGSGVVFQSFVVAK